jgi:hypothetical protein
MSVGGPYYVQDGGESECSHAGYYSGVGLYCKDSRTLRYVLVCDSCGAEVKEVSTVDYVPSPVFAAA